MAKSIYIGSGTAQKVKKIYFGDGNARKVKRGYIGGPDNLAHLFFTGATMWKKYNTIETITHYWNRFNLVSTTTYTWRKYQTQSEYHMVVEKSTSYDARNTDTVYRTATCNRGRIELSGSVLAVNVSSNLQGLAGYYVRMSGQVIRLNSVAQVMTTTRVRYNGSVMKSRQTTSQVYIGTVSSTDSSAYPNGGSQGGYYYDSRTSKTTQSKGTANGSVSSTNRSQYPDNNYSGSYWYVYDRKESSYSQGTYIQDVESDNPSAYPDNGRHTDGYWYVKIAE